MPARRLRVRDVHQHGRWHVTTGTGRLVPVDPGNVQKV